MGLEQDLVKIEWECILRFKPSLNWEPNNYPDSQSIKMLFGKKLKEIRTKQGVSQEELAKAMGVSDSRTVRHWERGTNAPTLENLGTLASALASSYQGLL